MALKPSGKGRVMNESLQGKDPQGPLSPLHIANMLGEVAHKKSQKPPMKPKKKLAQPEKDEE